MIAEENQEMTYKYQDVLDFLVPCFALLSIILLDWLEHCCPILIGRVFLGRRTYWNVLDLATAVELQITII